MVRSQGVLAQSEAVKAWEGEINVYQSGDKFYWDILCDKTAFDVSGRRGYGTARVARAAARRVMKRMGLVEQQAKAGKE